MGQFRQDTLDHIADVRNIGTLFAEQLLKRLEEHDASKLNNAKERNAFEQMLNNNTAVEYGTDAYKALSQKLKPAIELHYQNNSHHPEHFINGISDMNLLDLVEMFIDWAAATNRHPNDDIHKSIEINKERFDIPEELCSIFHNTANDLYL